MGQGVTDRDPIHSYLIAWRVLPDGRELHVTPATFGRARLNLTDDATRLSYSAGYCYAGPVLAVLAMHVWDPTTDPDPVGWEKHIQSGRYREHGDPALERTY
jgi:hypothetical protein